MPKPLKKIVYFMHVPWGWIRQRPHFIAEGLAQNYQVNVICEKNKGNNSEKFPDIENLRIIHYFDFLFKKNKIVSILSFLIRKLLIRNLIKKADVIWITYPAQYNYIKNIVRPNQIIIYDCMDDMIEFYSDKNIREKLKHVEKAICNLSNKIICSCEYLKNKLIARYYLNKEIIVINNAIKKIDEIPQKNNLPSSILNAFDNEFTKLVYIGTISSWFNFELILKTLSLFPNLQIIIIGPSDFEIPFHKNLIRLKAVEHKYIFDIMQLADGLVLPFIVTELIRSVNPVKIYEYIYSNKPSIVTCYGETEKFSDYVYLYRDDEEFIKLVDQLTEKRLLPKKSKTENFNFANQNTWENRMIVIHKMFNEYFA